MSIDNQYTAAIEKKIAKVDADAKAAADLTKITGYDATKVQVLKNDEGTIKWVTEEAAAE
jgi:hypothetical protein